MIGSASPWISSSSWVSVEGESGAGEARRPEKATIAPTGQRPLARASSAMIEPCEKPTSDAIEPLREAMCLNQTGHDVIEGRAGREDAGGAVCHGDTGDAELLAAVATG